MSITLQWHYAKQFLRYFIFALLGLSALVILFDVLELFRRSADKSYIDAGDVLRLSFYKLWQSVYLVFPFATMVSAMVFFLRKLQRNELTALKAFGTSSLQMLIAPCLCVFVIGLFNMTVMNYVSAQFHKKFEVTERNLFRQTSNQLSVSAGGLWLRGENESNRRTLIHAEGAEEGGQVLKNIQVFLLDGNHVFLRRIAAAEATLHQGYWLLRDVQVLEGQGEVRPLPFFVLETELTPYKITSGVLGPNSVSFLELWQFIGDLQASGFNTLNYRLHLQRLIAEPFFLLAVLLLVAGLLLHIKRRQQMKYVVTMTSLAFFSVLALYVLNNIIYAWGLQGYLPVAISAWTPPLIGLLVAGGFLLRLEEG